ncbi:MAG: CoA-binding protein [Deltaproteobacteria bacterium]|nr:CoA-binding protein [Deltaproteobacteria bacterium]MBW2086925.1 CoA-binding protein [Deltaproteobacteria bacterium]
MSPEKRQQLDRMFNPRGVAVFGGVSRAGAFAQSIILSLLAYGYQGRIYPVSRQGGEVAGLKIYRNLSEVQGPVDLASISVPAHAVPEVLRECLKHKVPGAQIHTSGFAETGESQGMALQEEISRIAEQGIRVIGPNCFGIHSSRGGISMLPGFDFSKKPGPVAMLSQSGGGACDFGHEAQIASLGLSKVISFGNGCDLDAVELLKYLAHDPETGYVAAYLEGVESGRKFFEIVRELTPKKPVVIWKGGLTPLGSRATQSHTGSLGGEARVWNGALAQAGAVPVQGLHEMIDTLTALAFLKSRGRRIALAGGGGAIGVFSSDLAHRFGLEVPRFSPETQARLRKRLPAPGNSVLNPLDTGTPVLPLEVLEPLIKEILTKESMDVLVMVMLLHPLEVTSQVFPKMIGLPSPPAGSYLQGLLEIMSRLKKQTGKDVAMAFENRATQPENINVESVSRKMRLQFQAEGIPVFTGAERALRGIRNALKAKRP